MAGELPSGEVTFVFTDIEGSTRLLRGLGIDRYEAALTRHRRVVQRATARYGGHIVRTIGDGTFIAFSEAEAALRACVEVLSEPLDASDGTGGALRVRIGAFRGNAVPAPSDGDYVHLAVHQAARVADAANGGQLLITSDLRESATVAGLEVVGLGAFRLRDFDAAQQLFTIGGDDLSPVTTPPRAALADAGNLPRTRTSFVGRDVEVREVAKLLADRELVTLAGPGGVGKTRVAVEVAARREEAAVFVDLAPLAAGGDVARAVARAVGLDDGNDPLPALCDHLARGRSLLVLDGCEAVIDAAADLAHRLLEQVPSLRLLATSRERLDVPGEVVRRLAPLPVPSATETGAEALLEVDSVRLLVERAASAGAEVDLERDGPAIASICRRLDGIPLGLELAAARLDELVPSVLDGLLDERFRVLDRGSRTAPERHRTLEAMVAWSFDRLRPEEKDALARLTIFPASFPRDAAEAIGAGGALQRLTKVSLVEATGEGRLRLLDTIRAFAQAVSGATTPTPDVEAALVDWCRAAIGAPADENVVLREHPTIVAALAAASVPGVERLEVVHAALPVWQRRGRNAEVLAPVLAVIDAARAEGTPAVVLAATSEQVAHLADAAGDPDLAAELADRAIAGLAGGGNDRALFSATHLRAIQHMARGDAASTQACLDAALEVARRIGEPTLEAEVLAGQGRVLAARGDPTGGVRLVRQAVDAGRGAGPSSSLAAHLDLLALLLGMAGASSEGVEVAEEGWEMARAVGNDVVADHIAVDVAQLAVRAGDPARAERVLVEVLPRLRERGDTVYLAGSSLVLSHLRRASDPADAADLAEEAARSFGAAKQWPGAASAYESAATSAAQLPDWVRARELLVEALAIRRRLEPSPELVAALVHLARAHWHLERPEDALAAIGEAIDTGRAHTIEVTLPVADHAQQLLAHLIERAGPDAFTFPASRSPATAG